jgi:hypothetical protein
VRISGRVGEGEKVSRTGFELALPRVGEIREVDDALDTILAQNVTPRGQKIRIAHGTVF